MPPEIKDLLDHTLSENFQTRILKRLADYKSCYERFYDFRSRKSGSKIFIDISLGFEPKRKLGEALELSSALKDRLELDIPSSEVNIIIRSFEEFDETVLNVDSPGLIHPMTNEYLDQCMQIAINSFTPEDVEKIKLELNASINPDLYSKELDNLGIEKLRYWVCLVEGQVAGFVGIYCKIDEPDAVWGGWLATRSGPAKADFKIKTLLIWKFAYESRITGRKYSRITSSNFPSERAANRLYHNVGYHVYKTEKHEDYEIYYLQGDSFELYEKNRPGKKHHLKNI